MDDLKAIRVVPGTKISHDYMGDQVATFGYDNLIEIGCDSVGIPAKQNNLLIIDVDAAGATHAHDGRKWWSDFMEEAGIPQTYSVSTPSGGAHYYFKLPVAINPETFAPPAKLADGVDIKWNGWVGAPPTAGYVPLFGKIADIIDAPPSLIAEVELRKIGTKPKGTNESDPFSALAGLHMPFSAQQITELRSRFKWISENVSLSRDEWRNGLFSLKAGCNDPDILDELIVAWTMNKGYEAGDEEQARSIVDRADEHGSIGPGTIFGIIKELAIQEGAPIVASAYTRQEIIDKAKVKISLNKDGSAKVAPTESNVASLIGAMFDSSVLYHDTRMDNFVYKGKVFSDAELSNIIAPMIQSPQYGLGFENISKRTIHDGIDVLMAARQTDPHKKWLDSLVWDKKERIDGFFPDYCHAKDNEYTRAVGRNMWMAMAGRGVSPGIKFDNIIILEGPEAARKSTLCEILGGEYTMAMASREDINSPDVLRRMHQSTVVELPELIGLKGKSGEEIKALLATRIDTIRDLYARKAVRRPRGFVFIGTTNETRYMKEDMGSRRYWPINLNDSRWKDKTIDTEVIKADREQLFAEAVFRFKNGEEFWDVPERDGVDRTNRRQESEPLILPIRGILKDGFGKVSLIDVFKNLQASNLISGGLTKMNADRIESSLRRLGAIEEEDTGMWFLEIEQKVVPVQVIVPTGLSSFL
jgi:hypothetical protein